MFRGLFARLTGEPKRGSALFQLAVGETRRAHWFVDAGVPDTLEGRFSVLATITAAIIARLEQFGPPGEAASVALTERFVESMDAEVRELGVSDPAIGKQVRSLVGALASRLERLRAALAGDSDWTDTARRCLYRDSKVDEAALAQGTGALRTLAGRLESAGMEDLVEGRLQ